MDKISLFLTDTVQIVAAFLAIRLTRSSQRRKPWLLMIMVCLVGVRRILILAGFITNHLPSKEGPQTIHRTVNDSIETKQAETEIRKLNEELEQRVADRTRELSALYEVTAVASELLDLETMLARSLERVLAAMRSKVGAIHLLDQSGQRLCLASQQGMPPDFVAQISPAFSERNPAGWVLEHGQPLLIPDLAADPRAPESVRTSDLQTYVGAPIRAGGQTLGVLSVVGKIEQQFNMEEVALLASIADQVGVAVENARLRQRAKEAAVVEERERLARDFHDSVTQSLYSLTLFAEAGGDLIVSGQLESAKRNFRRMGEAARQALREMRLSVHELRPPELERRGLVGALHQRLKAVEERVKVKARLVAGKSIELPARVEEELYRIAHEALNNALRHAAAGSVTIYLQVEGNAVELEVVDDGAGFDEEDAASTGGLGLVSMQERAEKLGGSMIIQTAPAAGTTIKVAIPIPDKRKANPGQSYNSPLRANGLKAIEN